MIRKIIQSALTLAVLGTLAACNPSGIVESTVIKDINTVAETVGVKTSETVKAHECAAIYVTNEVDFETFTQNRQGKQNLNVTQTVLEIYGDMDVEGNHSGLSGTLDTVLIKYDETSRVSIPYGASTDTSGHFDLTANFNFGNMRKDGSADFSLDNKGVTWWPLSGFQLDYNNNEEMPCNTVYTLVLSDDVVTKSQDRLPLQGYSFESAAEYAKATDTLKLMPLFHPLISKNIFDHIKNNKVFAKPELDSIARDTGLKQDFVQFLTNRYHEGLQANTQGREK